MHIDIQSADAAGEINGLRNGLEAERKARLAAEAANAAKTSFLALMRQDLRAPMDSIARMTERLMSSPTGIQQRQDIESFARSAQTLVRTLTEVLDFADLEAGSAELSLEPFDLYALVNAAAVELQGHAHAKGLMSAVEMTPNCPRYIVGDPARVRQVLMGLLAVALDGTTDGSIRLYVSANEGADPLTVRFDITDTGAGLTDTQIASLFEPAAPGSRAGGALGLPIARRLAEAMGGELGCTSAVGQGTLYWFTFQSLVADEAAVQAPQAPAAQPAAKEPRKGALSGHVLLVEGNTVNRMLIGAYLEEFGLTYETVDSGTAALMCVASRPYDLVLMDGALSDYAGPTMAARIRAMQTALSNVPIVILSPADSAEDLQALVAAGVNARVMKPIQGRELYAALVPFLPAEAGCAPLAKVG